MAKAKIDTTKLRIGARVKLGNIKPVKNIYGKMNYEGIAHCCGTVVGETIDTRCVPTKVFDVSVLVDNMVNPHIAEGYYVIQVKYIAEILKTV